MNSSPQQTSMRDLAPTLRAHRRLFVIVVVAAVAASLAYSLSQTPEYRATASVGFQDPSRDLGLAGVGIAPTQTAAQLAASNVPTISRAGVVASVQKKLRLGMTKQELLDAVTASVE